MDFASGAAAVAGVGAAAAYLNAKYHIAKDVGTIRDQRQMNSLIVQKVKTKRISGFYIFEEECLKRKEELGIWYRASPDEPITTYTWLETYNSTNQWARFLVDLGLRPGELVGTYLMNSPEFMFNLMGCCAAGCAPAMINCNLSGDGLVHSIKVPDTKILLVDEDKECQRRVEEIKDKIEALGIRIIVIDNDVKAKIRSYPTDRLDDSYRDHVGPKSPMFLFYTSGTTGFPKACPLPMVAANTGGKLRMKNTGIVPGEVWYDCMPLYHGTGGVNALGCMTSGVALAIGRKFSVRNFWKDVRDSRANAFVYVGETIRYLLAAPPSPLDKEHNVRVVYGNGLRPDVWPKFQERFDIPGVNEFFNSTEGMLALLNICRGPFHVGHVGHAGAIQRYRTRNQYVPVEIDFENGAAIWRDPKTGFAKRHDWSEGGEILIACQSKEEFGGYWGNPEATDKMFVRDVFKKGDLYYRTGDALRRDPDGRWYFLDRLGDTFRWKSENVPTSVVAEALGKFPDIAEANVYGVEVPNNDGRAGCAAIFIEPDKRASFDYPGLLKHSKKELPKYGVPVFLRVVKNPTPIHNNKQNKVPLRKEGIELNKIRAGDAGPEDVLLWAKPGANTYVPFTEKDYNEIAAGKVRL